MRNHSFMAFAASIAVAMTLCSCGGGAPAQNAEESEPVPPLTEAEVEQWLDGDSSFEGREATITGKVFNTDHEDDIYAFQVYTDPKNYAGNAIVYVKGDNPHINSDAYIVATGTVMKDFKGENAFGGSVTAACLQASSIEEVSYVEAVSPTLKSIEPGLVAEQNGYSITLNKVEFAADETRFYVTLTNNGAGRLSVYDYNAVLLQDGRQLNVQSNFEAGYPTINNELAVGGTLEGVICFPNVEQANMQLQLRGYSDNWEADGGELTFTFDIAV